MFSSFVLNFFISKNNFNLLMLFSFFGVVSIGNSNNLAISNIPRINCSNPCSTFINAPNSFINILFLPNVVSMNKMKLFSFSFIYASFFISAIYFFFFSRDKKKIDINGFISEDKIKQYSDL